MTQDAAKRLLGSGFPDDDGAADERLAACLAAWEAETLDYASVVTELAGCRLLVPVVAVLGEAETAPDGLARDKSSDMAAVLLTGADGRRALLAFTGTEALNAWNPEARPVPVTAPTAALAAVQEGADALVVDLAGPVRFVVEGPTLRTLATAASFGAGGSTGHAGD